MLSGETRVRIFNTRAYNIGAVLLNGHDFFSKPGTMNVITVDDVVYIDSVYPYFRTGELIIKDNYNKPVSLEDVGIYTDSGYIAPSEEEITSILKGTIKKIEAWLTDLKDSGRLDKNLAIDIGTVAGKLDLPNSKIKAIEKFNIEIDLPD